MQSLLASKPYRVDSRLRSSYRAAAADSPRQAAQFSSHAGGRHRRPGGVGENCPRPPLRSSRCRSAQVMSCLRAAYAAARLPTHDKKAFYLRCSESLAAFGPAGLAWCLEPFSLWLRPRFLQSAFRCSALAGSWVATLTFAGGPCVYFRKSTGSSKTGSAMASSRSPASLKRNSLCRVQRLCADLRAQTSGFLVASDASDNLGAFVSAHVARPLARELRRHTPAKGLWTRLLSPSEALLRSHRCLPEDRELPGSPPLEPACQVPPLQARGRVQAATGRPHKS